MKGTYSIYIADDHQMITDGLNSFFKNEENYFVKGTFYDGNSVLKAIKNTLPDILITDIKMPGISGIELVKKIKRDYPSIKVLVLSMFNESYLVRDISEAGADGYILKNTGKEELFRALDTILDGKKYYGIEVMNTLLNRVSRQKEGNMSEIAPLTFREKDILKHLVKGKTSKQIADAIHISIHTIDTHRKNIMRKTGTHNIGELINWALDNETL